MESLEITTSHNIVVSVELATVGQRMMATLLDVSVIGTYLLLIGLISSGSELMLYVLGMPVAFFYHLIFEYFNNGQSLGKAAMKLRVLSLSGERPSMNSLMMRWMFRLVDVSLTLGMLAAVFVASTKKKQRTGDILADTTVVKLQNDKHMSLSTIKSLAPKNYKVSYPQVTMYNDNDMLLVKDTLSRWEKNPSEDNRRMVKDLVNRITKDLKIKTLPTESIKFLTTLLSDYIILSR